MFPIPWNFPFRKKNGDLSTIGAEIGGAGSELPPHSSSDAGKLLGVKPNGSLEWSDTVNSEIQTLTNDLNDEIEARATLGAHNLSLPIVAPSSPVFGVNVTVNNDGVVTLDGTATGSGGRASLKSNAFTLKAGTYKLSKNASDSSIAIRVCIQDEPGRTTRIAETDSDKNDVEFTLANDTLISTAINVDNGVAYSNGFNIKPMITLISDKFNEYAPYAMTNRELTNKLDNNYVLITMGQMTVTGDGTKTVATLINELATAYLSMLQALPNDRGASVTAINSYVPNLGGTTAIPSITTGPRGIQKNTSSSINLVFQGFYLDLGANLVADLLKLEFNTNLSNCKLKGYDAASNTKFDDSSSPVPSGTNLHLYYSLYQQVQ